MALVALLSNPLSTGNRALLPKVRDYCAEHPDIFHYEVEAVDQIAKALQTIAKVNPKVVVINGGDGTVQATLTELYLGGHFGDNPPPVAVLPNGKTNLIALDLGANDGPLHALARTVELARGDLSAHIVQRELISLSDGSEGARPVLGMFLGGGGLADAILFCRHKIYPLGLPNGLSHALAAAAGIFSGFFNVTARFLPQISPAVRVSVLRDGEYQGNYALLIVTTLEKLLLRTRADAEAKNGSLKFFAVERNKPAISKMLYDTLAGKLGTRKAKGMHLERGDMIRIEGESGKVFLDGELFETTSERPIVLEPTSPIPFLRLAA